MADQPAAVHGLLAVFTSHKSRADGAMVAQELDQRMSTVLEGSTKAVVAIKFFGFFRQHPIHGPGTSAPAFENFKKVYAGDRPASGSGSCQRGRDRGIHRPRSSRPCSASYLASPGDWRCRI
jgi:hypothetical protein